MMTPTHWPDNDEWPALIKDQAGIAKIIDLEAKLQAAIFKNELAIKRVELIRQQFNELLESLHD